MNTFERTNETKYTNIRMQQYGSYTLTYLNFYFEKYQNKIKVNNIINILIDGLKFTVIYYCNITYLLLRLKYKYKN